MSATAGGRRLAGEQPVVSVRNEKEIAERVRVTRVSVVIPMFHPCMKVTEAIESALTQTCTNFEVVVIDDGSSADTESLAGWFGDRVLYLKQENQGAGAARNAGIKRFHDEIDYLPECKRSVSVPTSQAEFPCEPAPGLERRSASPYGGECALRTYSQGCAR